MGGISKAPVSSAVHANSFTAGTLIPMSSPHWFSLENAPAAARFGSVFCPHVPHTFGAVRSWATSNAKTCTLVRAFGHSSGCEKSVNMSALASSGVNHTSCALTFGVMASIVEPLTPLLVALIVTPPVAEAVARLNVPMLAMCSFDELHSTDVERSFVLPLL